MAGPEFFASLTDAISTDEPCGPDLDLAGDPDFLNSVAKAEGILPTSFFTRDDDGELIPFDRSTINFNAETKVLDRLLEGTRDFRLLTLYMRFLALNRDLGAVGDCVAAIAALGVQRWDDVHPKGEGGDFGFRAAILQAVDDMPTVVLPLQHSPLALSRRHGTLSFRTIMISRGEANGRTEDPVLDEATVERIFMEEDLEKLRATREQWSRIGAALDAVRLTFIEKAGFDQAVALDRLPDLVRKVLAVLDPIIVKRDPTAAADTAAPDDADGTDTNGPKISPGFAPVAIGDVVAAKRALGAVSGYFRLYEPSSPAALLIRQAQDLVGKTFYDILRALMPQNADDAKIAVGAEGVLKLTSALMSQSNEALTSDWGSVEATSSNDGEADDNAREVDGAMFEARTRHQANALLGEVGQFFRRTEPSSPIPMLLDRARSLMDRDFAALLRDVLPELHGRD